MLAHEVEHQATLLAGCQTQAATDLLLEQHRALRGAQLNRPVSRGGSRRSPHVVERWGSLCVSPSRPVPAVAMLMDSIRFETSGICAFKAENRSVLLTSQLEQHKHAPTDTHTIKNSSDGAVALRSGSVRWHGQLFQIR